MTLRLSLCNEMLAGEGKSLDAQCAIAAELGYCGLELAPGTLGSAPHRLAASDRAAIRATLAAHGLEVTGLHWLLAPYPHLSITEPAKASGTAEVLCDLVDLCADLGGSVLVHGSPGQRRLADDADPEAARAHAAALLAPVAQRAEARGVTYCIEPLSRAETGFLNTVAEADAFAAGLASPAFRTMIDTSAAGQTESEPVADLLRRWLPTGRIGHVQLNETARGAPGTGTDPFPDILRALRECGWDRPLAVEPFVARIDATVTAAIGAATVRACWEAAA